MTTKDEDEGADDVDVVDGELDNTRRLDLTQWAVDDVVVDRVVVEHTEQLDLTREVTTELQRCCCRPHQGC